MMYARKFIQSFSDMKDIGSTSVESAFETVGLLQYHLPNVQLNATTFVPEFNTYSLEPARLSPLRVLS
eukprot:scaffold88686_cov50-Attheya_sp.AAC.1